MSLRGRVSLRVTSVLTDPRDLDAPQVPLDVVGRMYWPHGAITPDQQFTDRRELDPGQSEDLALHGSLPNGLGGTLELARIMVLVVRALPFNTGPINVKTDNITGGQGTKAGDGVPVTGGGLFVWTSPSGAAVVPAEDEITFENTSGDSATYEVIIIGAST